MSRRCFGGCVVRGGVSRRMFRTEKKRRKSAKSQKCVSQTPAALLPVPQLRKKDENALQKQEGDPVCCQHFKWYPKCTPRCPTRTKKTIQRYSQAHAERAFLCTTHPDVLPGSRGGRYCTTRSMSDTSIPRAATSVATRTWKPLARNALIVWSRWCWEMSPWSTFFQGRHRQDKHRSKKSFKTCACCLVCA